MMEIILINSMDIDYIRVYRMSPTLPCQSQLISAEDPNARNIGCDPPNMPTSNYIARSVTASLHLTHH